MSTYFISRQPKTVADLEALGWIRYTETQSDPNTKFYTYGENTVRVDVADEHLVIGCFGGNDPEELFDQLELISEHEHELFAWLCYTRRNMKEDPEVFWQQVESSELAITVEEHVDAIKSLLPVFVKSPADCVRLAQSPIHEVRLLGLARMKQIKRSR